VLSEVDIIRMDSGESQSTEEVGEAEVRERKRDTKGKGRAVVIEED
jgi:hypothetical protein